MRIGDRADVLFFDVEDGSTVAAMDIELPEGTAISQFALDTEESGIFALGLDNGEAIVARYGFDTSFSGPNNTRTLNACHRFPFGQQPFSLFVGSALARLAVRSAGDTLMLAGTDADGSVNLISASKQTSLFAAFDIGGGDPEIDIENYPLDLLVQNVEQMFIGGDQRWLYFISSNGLIRTLDLIAARNGQKQ